MTGGGGVRVIFLGHEKKQRDFLGLQKKELEGIFWGYAKKVVIFMGRQILKL